MDFLNYTLDYFLKKVQWNFNDFRFSRYNEKESFLVGCDEAECVFYEYFWTTENNKKFYSKERTNIDLISYKNIETTFGLKDLSEKKVFTSKEEAYFDGIKEMYYIYVFLHKYNHPTLQNGSIVKLFDQSEDEFIVKITPEIITVKNTKTQEDLILPFNNEKNRTEIFLDEVFSLKNLYQGIGLKKQSPN